MMTTLINVAPVWTAESQQTIFRALLNALSFPGRVQDIAAPLGGERAELGILAALVDERVTIADPNTLLSTGERRLLAPEAIVAPDEAEYVLLEGTTPPTDTFKPRIGTIYRPEEAALLVLRVGEIAAALTPDEPNVSSVPSPNTGRGEKDKWHFSPFPLELGERVGDRGREGAFPIHLTGPGVEAEQVFSVTGLHPAWLESRNRWCDNFPTGCDLILCDTHQIVGIPRTATLRFSEEDA